MRSVISVPFTPEMRVERDARSRAGAAFWRLRTDSERWQPLDLAIQEWQRYADETHTDDQYRNTFIDACASALRGLLTHRRQ